MKKNKLTKLVAIGIMGAITNISQTVLEVMLDLQLLELFLKELAAKEAIRLRETKLRRQYEYGLHNIAGDNRTYG